MHDRRCIHYYSCVAAFAGDEKLSEEFASFVELERSQEIVLNLQEHSGTHSNDWVPREYYSMIQLIPKICLTISI